MKRLKATRGGECFPALLYVLCVLIGYLLHSQVGTNVRGQASHELSVPGEPCRDFLNTLPSSGYAALLPPTEGAGPDPSNPLSSSGYAALPPTSGGAADPSNPLWAWLDSRNASTDRGVRKWDQYIDKYHRHFAPFRGKPITVVEVGLSSGGSLDMWRQYFGPAARLIGVDIRPQSARFADGNRTRIFIGSQSDKNFWADFKRSLAGEKIAIFIDDGGHTAEQMRVTFDAMFSEVQPGGIYWVEDVHTQYWSKTSAFGGGLRKPGSFVERSKRLVDSMNGEGRARCWFCTAHNLGDTYFFTCVHVLWLVQRTGRTTPASSRPTTSRAASGASITTTPSSSSRRCGGGVSPF